MLIYFCLVFFIFLNKMNANNEHKYYAKTKNSWDHVIHFELIK